MVLLALLAAWQWYSSTVQMAALRQELAQRLHDSDADSRDARLVARQTQETVRESQARLAQLEAKLAESQNQQVALEALYQELARNRDESVLAEIEQILTVGAQQLQLAGNVQAGLMALQAADAQLARSDRPQFIPLRKILARDIDRLKAMPNLDMAGMSVRIDQLMADVDNLPLSAEARAAVGRDTADKRPAPESPGFWGRFGGEVWSELRSLVRIQVMDKNDPSLLAPGQAYFLRENLRLRLLSARLALLARDQATFREDVRVASAWVARWFDTRSKPVQTLQAALAQFSAANLQVQTPSIADSLNAVRNYKIVRDKPR
ncbi:MAG TPA: uroporphyrinogen-III C-methyltransferase [Burkholderiales bacterium]|nr:uroporphyrinogen-III C-methyltransferase [Burkholderiales bacterium]